MPRCSSTSASMCVTSRTPPQWYWAFQVVLSDGRVICDYDDCFQPRWLTLQRLVVPWATASDDDVDAKSVEAGGTAHYEFLSEVEWPAEEREQFGWRREVSNPTASAAPG